MITAHATCDTKSTSHALAFAGQDFFIIGEAGLYWQSQATLIVADLHLEKGSSYARRGQMIPPYDSVDTLEKLSAAAHQCRPRRIICLGDSFHDGGGEARLADGAAELLMAMTRAYEWIWITGNHDPHVSSRWGGSQAIEWTAEGVKLRHDANIKCANPEITGHYHPKVRVLARGKTQSRRCFVIKGTKMVMPAFGSYTGGMDAIEVARLIQPHPIVRGAPAGDAIVGHRSGISRFPL